MRRARRRYLPAPGHQWRPGVPSTHDADAQPGDLRCVLARDPGRPAFRNSPSVDRCGMVLAQHVCLDSGPNGQPDPNRQPIFPGRAPAFEALDHPAPIGALRDLGVMRTRHCWPTSGNQSIPVLYRCAITQDWAVRSGGHHAHKGRSDVAVAGRFLPCQTELGTPGRPPDPGELAFANAAPVPTARPPRPGQSGRGGFVLSAVGGLGLTLCDRCARSAHSALRDPGPLHEKLTSVLWGWGPTQPRFANEVDPVAGLVYRRPVTPGDANGAVLPAGSLDPGHAFSSGGVGVNRTGACVPQASPRCAPHNYMARVDPRRVRNGRTGPADPPAELVRARVLQ